MNYGMDGTGGSDGSGDIADIYVRIDKEERLKGTLADQNEGGRLARKMYFDTMKSRVVLTNTGSTTCYWEIFECTARTDIPLSEAGTMQAFYGVISGVDFQGSLQQGAGNPGEANVAQQTFQAIRPNVTNVGVTPFEFRHFCQRFKITKTTRFQASPGNSISFSANSTRNQTIEWDREYPLLAKKGVTKLYVARQWGAVQQTPLVQVSATQAAFEIERDYVVKILDKKVAQLNYIGYSNTS